MSYFDDNEDYIIYGAMPKNYYNFRTNKVTRPKTVTCKYCNKTNLRWFQADKGWLLLEGNGDKHVCLDPDFVYEKE